MARGRRSRGRRGSGQTSETLKGVLLLAVSAVVFVFVGWQLYLHMSGQRTLDASLCPVSGEESLTVVLVDVTDPLSVAQKQDLINQLESVRNHVPKYGRLSLYKVAAADQELLRPILDLCNPGDGSDVSEASGNPKKAREIWQKKFSDPLDTAFVSLTQESGATTSPVLQSVQSVALSKLQRPGTKDKPRRLVLVSDLLQNTAGLDFYKGVPTFPELQQTDAYRNGRADLRGVDMEIFMLSRPGKGTLQTSALAQLWAAAFADQGARVERVYNVNG